MVNKFLASFWTRDAKIRACILSVLGGSQKNAPCVVPTSIRLKLVNCDGGPGVVQLGFVCCQRLCVRQFAQFRKFLSYENFHESRPE